MLAVSELVIFTEVGQKVNVSRAPQESLQVHFCHFARQFDHIIRRVQQFQELMRLHKVSATLLAEILDQTPFGVLFGTITLRSQEHCDSLTDFLQAEVGSELILEDLGDHGFDSFGVEWRVLALDI